MQTCAKCDFIGLKEQYFYCYKSRDAYDKLCKICRNSKNKERYHSSTPEQKEAWSLQKKKYKKSNKEHIDQQNQEYRLENKKEIRQRDKNYYIKNKEKISGKEKTKRRKNPVKKVILTAEERKHRRQKVCHKYYLTHKQQVSKRSLNNYHRRKNDPTFILRKIVSITIWSYLKKNLSHKNNSIINYLSYSITQLKQHLESLWEPWMTWGNYGKYDITTWKNDDPKTWTWNIDHIIPQSKLAYTSMEQDNFKTCWALSNLRPYSAKQNLLDSNRR